ncbi:hypothetical protein CP971_32295 [Streptomyces viridifaciens]|nr:hypothetical protein CP971_32295 [Streptomyces viridifaciens]
MGIEIDPGKTCVVVAAARILAAPGRVIDEQDGAPGRRPIGYGSWRRAVTAAAAARPADAHTSSPGLAGFGRVHGWPSAR